jgi:hypothetical protein
MTFRFQHSQAPLVAALPPIHQVSYQLIPFRQVNHSHAR